MPPPSVTVTWQHITFPVSGWLPQYAINGQPFPTPTGGVWAVDAGGGVFQETNQGLAEQISSWAAGEWQSQIDAGGPASPIQDPRANGGVPQPLPAGDTQDAAYFLSKEAAFFWLQNLSGRTVSSGNKLQQLVQGYGAQWSSIGQDFASGNFGAGLEGTFGELVNTTPIGAGTGFCNTLLQGAGALSDPEAQITAGVTQMTGGQVVQVGFGAMTGGPAGALKATMGAISEDTGTSAPSGSSAPPPSSAAPASSGGGIVSLVVLGVLAYLVLR